MFILRKKIDPRCAYCARGVPLAKQGEIGCVRRGVMDAGDFCRSFRYDPMKRVPPKPVRLRGDYTDADFKIV